MLVIDYVVLFFMCRVQSVNANQQWCHCDRSSQTVGVHRHERSKSLVSVKCRSEVTFISDFTAMFISYSHLSSVFQNIMCTMNWYCLQYSIFVGINV